MRTQVLSSASAIVLLSLGACGSGEPESETADGTQAAASAEMALEQSPAAQPSGELAQGSVRRRGAQWVVVEDGDPTPRQLATTNMQEAQEPRFIDLEPYVDRRLRFRYQVKGQEVYWGVQEDTLEPYRSAVGRIDQSAQRFIENGDPQPRQLTEQGQQVGQNPSPIPLTGISRQLSFEYESKTEGWYWGVEPATMKQAQQ